MDIGALLRKFLGIQQSQSNETAEVHQDIAAPDETPKPIIGQHHVEEPEQAPPGAPVEVHIGLDFGTSYTKACYYILEKDKRSIVKWNPSWLSRDESLLPSLLWIDGRDTISMSPLESAGSREIRFFKMGVAGQIIGRSVEPAGKSLVQACRLYSAFFLARAFSWIESFAIKQDHFVLAKKTIIWSGNMGIPIAYKDSPLDGVFSEVLNAARYMLPHIADSEPLARIDELYQASMEVDRNPYFSTVPELYAEAYGLFSDYHTPTGSYAIFDIGGGTVDGAALYFTRNDGIPSVNFITAEVDALGVEVVAERLVAKKVDDCQEAARSRLLREHDQSFAAINDLEFAMQRHTANVIATVKKRMPNAWKGAKELPVMLCGGGQASAWHRNAIRSTYSDFQHHQCRIPPYTVQNLRPALETIAGTTDDQMHRFLIAIGLSIPEGTGPDIVGFPSSNPDLGNSSEGPGPDLDDIQNEKYGG